MMSVTFLLAMGANLFSAAQAPSVEQGRQIVHASCETCHSLALGKVKIGPSLYGELNTKQPRATAAQVLDILAHGRNKMPAYASVFSDMERRSIVTFLRQIP